MHGLQILQALDYLHARGLLHIDVKPENIIRFGEQGADGPRDRVRLIDFGAVWKLGSPGPVSSYTEAYAPPKTDQETCPTVGFDLFCLGSTLQVLCRRQLRDPAAPGVVALDRLLKRATDTGTPGRRFVSARQFAEQLSRVIRQVVAAPTPAGGSPGPRRCSGRCPSRCTADLVSRARLSTGSRLACRKTGGSRWPRRSSRRHPPTWRRRCPRRWRIPMIRPGRKPAEPRSSRAARRFGAATQKRRSVSSARRACLVVLDSRLVLRPDRAGQWRRSRRRRLLQDRPRRAAGDLIPLLALALCADPRRSATGSMH